MAPNHLSAWLSNWRYSATILVLTATVQLSRCSIQHNGVQYTSAFRRVVLYKIGTLSACSSFMPQLPKHSKVTQMSSYNDRRKNTCLETHAHTHTHAKHTHVHHMCTPLGWSVWSADVRACVPGRDKERRLHHQHTDREEGEGLETGAHAQ